MRSVKYFLIRKIELKCIEIKDLSIKKRNRQEIYTNVSK